MTLEEIRESQRPPLWRVRVTDGLYTLDVVLYAETWEAAGELAPRGETAKKYLPDDHGWLGVMSILPWSDRETAATEMIEVADEQEE